MQFKHFLPLTCLFLLISVSALAQNGIINNPKVSLELKMQQDGGANGAAVVFNPQKNYYYAAFAGNSSFPLETFDGSGKPLAQHSTGVDVRGMWWNAKNQSLEGNCYGEGGIVQFGLSSSAYASSSNEKIFEESLQPNEQAVGMYNARKKEILFYSDGELSGMSRKSGKKSKTAVSLSLPVSSDRLNETAPIFTRQKKMEIGLLDVEQKKVYLFNRKTGEHTATVNLPLDAVVYEYFNWSYANGHVFLFDKEARVWRGYRIFSR